MRYYACEILFHDGDAVILTSPDPAVLLIGMRDQFADWGDQLEGVEIGTVEADDTEESIRQVRRGKWTAWELPKTDTTEE